MSYCRFENTSMALRDCVDAINDGDIDSTSSHSEIDGMEQILEYARQIVDMEDSINEIINNSSDDE